MVVEERSVSIYTGVLRGARAGAGVEIGGGGGGGGGLRVFVVVACFLSVHYVWCTNIQVHSTTVLYAKLCEL